MMVAGLKYLHLAAMLCWCAALVALPLLLHFYGQIWRGKADSRMPQGRTTACGSGSRNPQFSPSRDSNITARMK